MQLSLTFAAVTQLQFLMPGGLKLNFVSSSVPVGLCCTVSTKRNQSCQSAVAEIKDLRLGQLRA